MTVLGQSVISTFPMIKRILNRSKDYLIAVPGIERHWINRLKGKVSCLLYHRVDEYGRYAFLDEGGSPVINESDFDRELCYLKSLPTRFYTLSDLIQGKFPDRDTIGIVICFDDGFKCNYDQGLRLLNKHNVNAVFFQCTGFINAQTLNWEHLLYWLYHNRATQRALLNRLNNSQTKAVDESIHYFRENIDSIIIEQHTQCLVEEFGLQTQINELALQLYPDEKSITLAIDQGNEIASHGHNHYKRDTISDELFESDLMQSKAVLSQITGDCPLSYSYPFNSYFEKDHGRVNHFFATIANVAFDRIHRPLTNNSKPIPRLTWPGISPNQYRMKRWLLTGKF